MRDILLFSVIFGSLPVCFMRPWIGVLVFSWISYMNPHRLTWSAAYDYPFITTLIGLFFTKDRMRLPLKRETILIILLGCYFTLTNFYAFNPRAAWFQWEKVIKILAMTLVTISLINNEEKLKYLVMVIAFSIGFYGVKGGVFSILTGGQYHVFGPAQSFFEDNNDLALALCMVLPIFYYLAREEKHKWMRLILWIALGFSFIAIIFTFSRGGFLTLAGMLFIFLLKSKKKVLAAVLILIERMETIQTYEEDNSAMGRINAWETAWNLAKDRPLTGGGFETFIWPVFVRYAPDPNNVHDVHSIYFEIIGEHGFVAFSMFMALILFTLMTTREINKMAGNNAHLSCERSYAHMFQISLLAYMIGGLFLGRAYFDLFYHIVAMVIIVRVLILREVNNTADAISEIQPGSMVLNAKKTSTKMRGQLRPGR
jgi:probable O-glycosylation ligase (exosortase A-associated)